jgi:hypothetical protein
MRWIWLLAACSQSSGAPDVKDLSVAVVHDLAVNNADLTPPSACNPVDPMSDGQACGAGCPSGTVGVGSAADCKCWLACDPATPTQCPCDRRCAPLTRGDLGVVGGACLIANGPGERCGQMGVTGPSAEGCAQSLLCVNADDPGMFRYCVYDCTGNLACPAQTMCLQLTGVATEACVYNSVTGGLAAGTACMSSSACAVGLLCDGTCKPQCDRVGAACASGTCTALSDGNRTVGYVCK